MHKNAWPLSHLLPRKFFKRILQVKPNMGVHGQWDNHCPYITLETAPLNKQELLSKYSFYF